MKKLKVLNNEGGFLKFIFTTAVIVFLIYAGIKFGMPYYKYSAFKSDTKELARISTGQVEKTRSQIFERAQELKLPLEEKDIVVTSSGAKVQVKTSWSETVDILGLYQKTLNFKVDVEE